MVDNLDVIKATVEGQWNSQQDFQNVYHLQYTGATITDAAAIASIIVFLEALMTLLDTALNVLYVVRDVRFLNVTQAADMGLGLFADATPGVGVGNALPPQNALGITLSTVRLNVRGRKFFGGFDEDIADEDGVLTGTMILELADVGDLMTTQQFGAGGAFDFGVIASFDGVFLPFLSYTIPTTVVTQRRRRLGVGS